MGYRVIQVQDIAPTPDRPSVQRSVSEAADCSRIGVHVYEAAPGEQLPLAYHYHEEQEEVFYVLSGTLYVETPEETFVVGSDEAFVAHPESPHRAYNPSDAESPVRVLAVGAPVVDDVHPYDPDDE